MSRPRSRCAQRSGGSWSGGTDHVGPLQTNVRVWDFNLNGTGSHWRSLSWRVKWSNTFIEPLWLYTYTNWQQLIFLYLVLSQRTCRCPQPQTWECVTDQRTPVGRPDTGLAPGTVLSQHKLWLLMGVVQSSEDRHSLWGSFHPQKGENLIMWGEKNCTFICAKHSVSVLWGLPLG